MSCILYKTRPVPDMVKRQSIVPNSRFTA